MSKLSLGSTKPLEKGQHVKGQIIQIFAATRNTDGNEGRGSDIDHSYHLTKRNALIGAHGIDVMGSDGKVRDLLALQVEDGGIFLLGGNVSLAEISPIKIVEDPEAFAKLRKSALDKLSPGERVALNLDL